ncbi:hypothetical protein I549_0061 [Mycobacterium avium subsp. avium 2285 (R)]|uniref:Uncharacterized protein n=1 Tax=Mycobacterium avium (strain 104) TaxID=243243 RepID=A0A0H2ZSW8_MYCA1|nr:hypothetical protein MAV_0131 [Mycobacterium avium 104]ETZ44065.1 hypothetical protein L837_4187 [Mycobacterium avium MAV_061107_1842]EUA41916.1 hypothetical protein I549_0061 [Mycobacterium avium subsp. avium 2285 (R)]
METPVAHEDSANRGQAATATTRSLTVKYAAQSGDWGVALELPTGMRR